MNQNHCHDDTPWLIALSTLGRDVATERYRTEHQARAAIARHGASGRSARLVRKPHRRPRAALELVRPRWPGVVNHGPATAGKPTPTSQLPWYVKEVSR
jgi:hypothetical protein